MNQKMKTYKPNGQISDTLREKCEAWNKVSITWQKQNDKGQNPKRSRKYGKILKWIPKFNSYLFWIPHFNFVSIGVYPPISDEKLLTWLLEP